MKKEIIREARRKSAVFVDYENLYMSMREESNRPLEATLEMLGRMVKWLTEDCNLKIVIGRAYGTWDFSATREALQPLSFLGITPQYVLTRRARNTGDLKLCLDLLEVLIQREEIDTFVIVGGDRDYIYIAERIREQAREVLVVSPSRATSVEFKEIIGQDNFIDALSLLPPELLEKPEIRDDGDQDVSIGHSDLMRCARLFLRARQELRATDIWLGPFFKSYMNEEFANMSNLQRKDLISELVRREAIEIEDREDRYGSGTFSVVLPNWSHDIFTEAEADGNSEAAGTEEAAGADDGNMFMMDDSADADESDAEGMDRGDAAE